MDIISHIQRLAREHEPFVKRAQQAERYYLNENDIVQAPSLRELDDAIRKAQAKAISPLRNADNRISHNWHQLLVDQKASYAFTYPPMFDLGQGSKRVSKLLTEALGDDFTRYCSELCVEASNAGRAWLHYWVDSEGAFQYAPVPATQVIPVYSGSLKRELIAVLRCYMETDENGKAWRRYEYWTDKEYSRYQQPADENTEISEWTTTFEVPNAGAETTNIISHPFGRVPFIEFANNRFRRGDLDKYKGLIDLYDKIYSGFGNDLEDIQEVIYVLRNYGGEDAAEILRKFKLYKFVHTEDGEDGQTGGLDTLTIEIPVEARRVALELTRRQIFVSGQGVDPDPEKFGSASGVALKFLYSLLEMKVGLMEAEFRSGFNDLVRAILEFEGVALKGSIVQTYTRASVNNELENAQIGQMLTGILSEETVLQNLDWVDDKEAELDRLAEEREAAYSDPYGTPPKKDEEDDDGEVDDDEDAKS